MVDSYDAKTLTPALSQSNKLHLYKGNQSSGGSDCQRQSVCRNKKQQFQLSLPMRLCSFQSRGNCGFVRAYRPDCWAQSRLP